MNGLKRGHYRAATALLILSIGVLYAFIFQPGQDWDDDSSTYITNMTNLVEGRPYGETTFVPNPSFPFLPSIMPPGLPLLLAPVYRMYGLSLTAMKVEQLVFLLLALALVVTVFARDLPSAFRLLLVTAVAFHPLVWSLKDRILSDIPFLTFVLLTLWLVEQLSGSDDDRVTPSIGEVSAALAMFAAFLTRYLGIVLPCALILRDLLHKQRPRSTFRVLGVSAALVLVELALFPSDPELVDRLPRSFSALLRNAQDLGTASTALWRVGDSRIGTLAVAYIIDITAAVGVFERFRIGHRTSMTDHFFILYVVALLGSAARMLLRYLLPFVPFLLYYSLVGVTVIGRGRPWARRLALGMWIGAACAMAVMAADVYQSQLVVPRVESVTAQDMFRNIRDRTTPTDLIVFGHPRTLALWTGRRTTLFNGTTDAGFFDFWQSVAASHVLAGPHGVSHEVDGIVMRHPGRFALAYENSDYRLYRIRPLD